MKKSSLSIFTTMTNPDDRNDPWKEALNCYEELGDEVIVVGKNWPFEFSWDEIGKTFQEGLDKSSSDWVIRMDIDYFFHEIRETRFALELCVCSLDQYESASKPRKQQWRSADGHRVGHAADLVARPVESLRIDRHRCARRRCGARLRRRRSVG